MSLLTLVRHGQASYLEETYDRLSSLGEVQARKLGDYWAARGVWFDRVIHGPAERQRRTGEIVGEEFRRRGCPWPEAAVASEFNEFDGERVVRTLAPVLAERHDHVREMLAACEAASDTEKRKRAVDRLFHEVARRWVAGEVSAADVESWEQFMERVRRGVNRAVAELPPDARAVVFTSAGPTAVTVSLALRTPPAETLELAFRPRNGSWSEFSWNGSRLTLDAFNAVPHLDEPDLLTWR